MSDIAAFSFSVDTAPLNAADIALQRLAERAGSVEAILNRFSANAAAAFAKVPASMSGLAGTSSTGGGSSGLSSVIAEHDRLAASIGKTTAALGKATKAHGAHGAAAYGNRLQMMELAHVGRALFDELAAGGNIFRGLAMESGRLQIALGAGEGGLAGMLGRIGGAAGMLVNPFTIGVAAVATLGAAAMLATSRVRELDLEMSRATGGAGRFAGLSGEGLSALASTQAADFNMQQRGIGLGDARAAAMALARTGRLDASNIAGVMGLAPGYAGLTGSSFSDSSDKLAKIFADPVRGMGELEKVVGALDDRTRQAVVGLTAQGDAQAAVRLLVDRTTVAFNEMVQPQSGWSRFTTWWSDRNAQLEGSIAAAVAGPTPEQRYRDASRFGGAPGLIGTLQSRGRYDDGTSDIAEDLRHRAMLSGASPSMNSEAAGLLANQQSQAAGDIVRHMLPDLRAHQDLVDQQTSL